MEAERVFKGAHCRTPLPTGDRLLHLLCAALGHLWGWIIQPDCLSCSNGLIRLHTKWFFFLKSPRKFLSLWETLSLLPHGGYFHFCIFAQGKWIPNTRMCSSMRKHVTLTLRTSLGEGWRNLSYFCRNNPFSGTISNVNNQVLYFLRLFPMQCLSVAKGGHCTIMHGRYDDNSELSFITFLLLSVVIT